MKKVLKFFKTLLCLLCMHCLFISCVFANDSIKCEDYLLGSQAAQIRDLAKLYIKIEKMKQSDRATPMLLSALEGAFHSAEVKLIETIGYAQTKRMIKHWVEAYVKTESDVSDQLKSERASSTTIDHQYIIQKMKIALMMAPDLVEFPKIDWQIEPRRDYLAKVFSYASLHQLWDVVEGLLYIEAYSEDPVFNEAFQDSKTRYAQKINKSIDFDNPSFEGFTEYYPLESIINFDQVELLKIVLSIGVDINKPLVYKRHEKKSSSLLAVAIRHKNPAMVRMLLENGADVNDAHYDSTMHEVTEERSIFQAIRSGDIHIFNLVMQYNPQLDIRNFSGVSPYLFAAYLGHDAMVKYFIDHKLVDINERAPSGNTALMYALGKGQKPNSALAEYLLQNGIEYMMSNNKNEDPIQLAQKAGFTGVVDTIIQQYGVKYNDQK